MEDWFMIPRHVMSWDRNARELFLLLLSKADDSGCVTVSVRSLARELGLSVQSIRTSLSKLEVTQWVTHSVTQGVTHLIVCDFDSYKVSSHTRQHTHQHTEQHTKENPLPSPAPSTNPKEKPLFLKENLSKESEKKRSLPPEGEDKKTIPPPPSLEERQRKFYNSLIPFMKDYTGAMLREFYDYWSEPDRSAKPKMRWEKQPTWDLKRRLARWGNNQKPERQSKQPGTSKLDYYKQAAIQLGIYHDGAEQDGNIDEQ